jgi:septation ring formation regulator EzrA
MVDFTPKALQAALEHTKKSIADIEKKTEPLREKQADIRKKMAPFKQEMKKVTDRIKELEAPSSGSSLYTLKNQYAAITRAMGNRVADVQASSLEAGGGGGYEGGGKPDPAVKNN